MSKRSGHLTKEGIQIKNKHMTRCSISYVIKKLQIKTIMKYHYTSMGCLKSKTLTIPNADKDVEQQNSYSLLVGMQNGTATLEDSLAVSYKTKHTLTI